MTDAERLAWLRLSIADVSKMNAAAELGVYLPHRELVWLLARVEDSMSLLNRAERAFSALYRSCALTEDFDDVWAEYDCAELWEAIGNLLYPVEAER